MTGFAFTLRQIEIFEVLRDCRNFRVAAERLGVSQAAVSNHLKSLESQLGTTLFAREPGRRPSLTAQGMAFARDLQPFLASAAVLNGHRRRAEEVEPHRFKIYVGISVLEDYVRPKLDRFLGTNPEIDLEFQAEAPGPATLRKIREDRFDFALLHLLPQHELDDPARLIARCRSGIFAHRRLLPRDNGPLTADEISALPFVLPRPGSEAELGIRAALEAIGVRPTNILNGTQYFNVMACMVEQGLGAGLMCEAFIRPEMRGEVAIVRPLEPWRMMLRRRPGLAGAAAGAVERFLVESVLADGRYPALAMETEKAA